jgi:hypothetical protein
LSSNGEVALDRKRLLMGVGAGVVILAVCVTGVVLLWRFLNPDPSASQREPVTALGYCDASEVTPCIVSFGSDGGQTMLVNVLTPGFSYPYFYLTIERGADDFFYSCKPIPGFSTSAICTGWPMPPGEALQFKLFAVADDTLLAEGQFAIIGLMLPSPVAEPTSTLVTETPMPAPTEIVLETSTPEAIDLPGLFPTATPTGSYPNPSYPGPSYSNP